MLNLWPKKEARPSGPTRELPYSILVDSATLTVLVASSNPSVITFLAECTPDTRAVISAQFPKYTRGFPLARVASVAYPEWTWSGKDRTLTHAPSKTISPALRIKSELASAKAPVLAAMMAGINKSRSPAQTGFVLQETIYMIKQFQARAFRDSGYDESRVIEYPFILQYADSAGISPAQAADDILFKAKLDEDYLLRTEGLRLTYVERLRHETDPKKLPDMLKQFLLDCNFPQIT